jgi:hypothetical protein
MNFVFQNIKQFRAGIISLKLLLFHNSVTNVYEISVTK